MANTITAMPGQSTADLIIQSMGTLQGAYDFCTLNGCALSDIPAVGTVYKIPALTASNSDQGKLAWMAVNGVTMATGAAVPAAPVGLATNSPLRVTQDINFAAKLNHILVDLCGIDPATTLWYTSATGGSPVPMPSVFPDAGLTVKNYWVSVLAGGEESPRVAFTILVYSLVDSGFAGDTHGMYTFDLSSGSYIDNPTECGVATVTSWKNVATGAIIPYSGRVLSYPTGTGTYEIWMANAAGDYSASATFYVTIVGIGG